MNTKLILSLTCVLFSAFCYANNPENTQQESQTTFQFKVSYLHPGLEVEFPIQRRTSIVASANLGITLDIPIEDAEYRLTPCANLQYRFYYDLDVTKNNTNTGYYVAFKCSYNAKDIYNSYDDAILTSSFSFGPRWGWQWNKKHTYANIDLGPCFTYNSNDEFSFSFGHVFACIGWVF